MTGVHAGTATITHTYSSFLFIKQKEEFTVSVTGSNTAAYFYILNPDLDDPDAAAKSSANWYYAGLGTVTLGPAVNAGNGAVYRTDLDEYIAAVPSSTGYPDITYNGETYEYDASGTGVGTYTITWVKVSEAAGATTSFGKETLVGSSTPTWHVDGVATPVTENDCFVFFNVDGETVTTEQGNALYYKLTKGSILESSKVPAYPTTKEVGGVSYVFDGWYTSSDYSGDKVDFSEYKINENTTFYAHYTKDENEDRIPDKYQVKVTFVSANDVQGSVSGDTETGIDKTTQIFTLTDDEGAHATTGKVTPTLDGVVASGKSGFTFDYWTKDSGTTAVDPTAEITIDETDSHEIVFKANFTKDEWDEDDPNSTDGDGIADKYQVKIVYQPNPSDKGTVSRDEEVKTIYTTVNNGDGTTTQTLAQTGTVDITGATAAVTEAAKASGYAFINWTAATDKASVSAPSVTGEKETLSVLTIENAVGGTIYTFTANFAMTNADILDNPTIWHKVNTDETPAFETTDSTAKEHLVEDASTVTISYEATLDLTQMELNDTVNGRVVNAAIEKYSKLHSDSKLTLWDVVKANWNGINHANTTIDLYVKFDSNLDTSALTQDDLDAISVTSPYFEKISGKAVEFNQDGYLVIHCVAKNPTVERITTAGVDADKVILSNIKLSLTDGAQKTLTDDKDLSIVSGGYIEGVVTFGTSSNSIVRGLPALTIYGKAEDDTVNLTMDTWNDATGGGDGIPDKYQAILKYVADSHSTVSGTTTKVITLQDAAGNYVASKTMTPGTDGVTYKIDSDYKFNGWEPNPNVEQTINGGRTYTFKVTTSYDGKVEDDSYELRYNPNGGTVNPRYESETRPWIKDYDELPVPSRPGYVFTGWYDKSGNLISDDVKVDKSQVTITAGWRESAVPGMLNGDDHFAYIQGYADGTVRPNNYITRAQVATIFFRLLDEDIRDENLTTYNDFPDVAEDYWANTAISTMTELGVIHGYKDGNFRPNAYITRAEFAAICARFDDTVKSGNSSFTDINGHWAKAEIERAATLGWIQGYSDGTFRPNNNITRAQAMTMINRVLCRLPEDEDDLLRGMNTWTDCNPGDWCYLAVQEATNSHDFQHRGVYESWTDLNRDPDWSKYEN